MRSVFFSRRSSSRVVPTVSFEPSAEINELRRENKSLRDALSKAGARIAGSEQEEQDPKKLIQAMSSVYGPNHICPRDVSSTAQNNSNMQTVIREIDRMSRELDITNGLLKKHQENGLGCETKFNLEMSTVKISDVRGLEDAHWRITQLDRSVGENRSYVLGLVQPPPPPPIVVVVNVDNDDQPRRRCSSGRGDGFITVRAGIAAWSETAACPGFEVSSSIPACKAFLSDDVEICEID
jgi:hypothetical protein